MRRRNALLLAGAVVAASAGVMPMAARATAVCPVPSVSGVSTHMASIGTAITVNGSGFTDALGNCSTAVVVGGVNQTITSKSSSQIVFTLSAGGQGVVNGPMVVTLTDTVTSTGSNSSSGSDDIVTTPTVSTATLRPHVGDQITVSGTNLNGGGSLLHGASASWSTAQGSCPGSYGISGVSFNAAPVGSLGSFCNGSVRLTLTYCATSGCGSTVQATTAAVPVDVTPVVSAGAPASAVAGSDFTVSGSGFGTAGASGGFPTSSWSDTAIGVSVPQSAVSGTLTLTRADGAVLVSSPVAVQAHIDSVSPSTVNAGGQVTISGGGFGNDAGKVALGSTTLPVVSWSATSVVVTVPTNAVSGQLALTPGDGNLAPGATGLSVAVHIGGINPGHATPGATIEITGSGFGTASGGVTIGGKSAPVSLWGVDQVVVTVPSTAPAGTDQVVLALPNGGPTATASFTVDKPPAGATPAPSGAATPASSSSASASSSSAKSSSSSSSGLILPSAGGPIITTRPVPFVKMPKPPSPVDLTLTATKQTADPGADVPFTVVLMAFGKPVVGAPVDLTMVVEPGTDASLTPEHAVTDAQGRVQGVLHLSKHSGDHIVLARSGIYSDEIRVVGRDASVAALVTKNNGPQSPAASVVRTSVLWLLVGVVGLFGTGFAINLATMRAPAAAGRRGVRGRTVNGLRAAGHVTQFAGAMTVAGTAQMILRVLRRR